jgi:hypothetical protein
LLEAKEVQALLAIGLQRKEGEFALMALLLISKDTHNHSIIYSSSHDLYKQISVASGES